VSTFENVLVRSGDRVVRVVELGKLPTLPTPKKSFVRLPIFVDEENMDVPFPLGRNTSRDRLSLIVRTKSGCATANQPALILEGGFFTSSYRDYVLGEL